MAGSICPIFERKDEENVNLIGLWAEHPHTIDLANGEQKMLQIAFMEVIHLAPMLAHFIANEECRLVTNKATNVGNGNKYIGGAYIIGKEYFAPNEKGGIAGIDYEYNMSTDRGINILIRTKITRSSIEKSSNNRKKWWQFRKKKELSKNELRNLLLESDRNLREEHEKTIIKEGKEITSKLADLAIEFDPDNMNQEKFIIARTATYLIGEIGYLDNSDAEKIFNQLIKNRTPAESVKNNWNGLFSQTVTVLKELGHIR